MLKIVSPTKDTKIIYEIPITDLALHKIQKVPDQDNLHIRSCALFFQRKKKKIIKEACSLFIYLMVQVP